ncbi:MAG: glycosyltransferase [Lachnospiraceae bacterium]|nr:glycosyltransferase [Lachnospiraceae bacterium]
MKKILFMIPTLGHGGAEKVLVNLVNNMDKKLFDITVLVLFDGGVNRQFLSEHIHYKAIFKKTFPFNCKIMTLLSPKFLHRMFIKDSYDIEISYLEGPTARIIAGGKEMWSSTAVPHVSTQYIGWIHGEQHNAKNASYAFRSYKEAKNLYGKFDKIVCVSNTVAEDFRKIFNINSEIEVLYNTLESEKIRKESTEEANELELIEGEINIVSVGTLKAVKGFDRLLRIHQRLRNINIPVHTYLLGEGEDEAALKQQAKELGISSSVTFLGYKTNPYKYVAKCDLFVCSSHREGFSTAATEALIVGTPVCTTLVSGMKEMLGENNEYGYITENNEDALLDGIKRLLTNSELLLHYKKKSEERGKFFSTERTVRQAEEMLLSL